MHHATKACRRSLPGFHARGQTTSRFTTGVTLLGSHPEPQIPFQCSTNASHPAASLAFAAAMSAPSSFSTLLLLTCLPLITFAQSLVNPTTAAPSATPLNSAFGYEYVGCWNETTGFRNNDGARALGEEGKTVRLIWNRWGRKNTRG